jgi:hypothetical protein
MTLANSYHECISETLTVISRSTSHEKKFTLTSIFPTLGLGISSRVLACGIGSPTAVRLIESYAITVGIDRFPPHCT